MNGNENYRMGISVQQKYIVLENQLSNGAMSFYLIAAAIFLDGLLSILGKERLLGMVFSSTCQIEFLIKNVTGSTFLQTDVLPGFFFGGVTLLFTGFFFWGGISGKKRHANIVLTGIILYVIDGIIGFLLSFNVGVLIVHAGFLLNQVKMFRAIKEFMVLETMMNLYKSQENYFKDSSSSNGLSNNYSSEIINDMDDYVYDPNYKNNGGYDYDNDEVSLD